MDSARASVRGRLVFGVAVILAGALLLTLGAASPAFAVALTCDATTGVPGAGECQITTAHAVTGPVEVDRTLHVFGNGRLDASGGGITLSICVAPAAVFSACDLILDTPTVVGGGQIEANDTGSSGASASDITINVSRDVLMQAGSAILAENTSDGGDGGDITITAGGDMTMCGQTGVQPGCGAPGGNPGALISSRKTAGAGDTGVSGAITITVGDQAKATGTFYMEGGSTGYGTETGAKVLSTGPGRAGDISITSGHNYFTEPGSVVEAGGPTGASSAVQQGAKIFLVSDCGLTTRGRVTSKGPDPGADLVHLESCDVLIQGLVESTGKGHTTNAKNSCDAVNDGLPGEVVRAGKPSNATGCIEVWGNNITIDSTNGWAGELNADIGNGGAGGTSWIDIFARSKLTVTDGTGNDRSSDNLGHTYFSTYAVHANTIDGSDNTPSVITALVKNGPLTASGKAFEASATLTNATGHGTTDEFVGNGSTGGTIDLEASGTVTLDNAFVNASGDFFGGTPCPSGQGACGSGGHIIVKAWGVGSNISWMTGSGDVRPDNSAVSPPPTGGDITLNACGTIDTTGTDFHGETPSTSTGGANCDASKPDIPTITAINGGPVFKTDLWALCGESSISGIKFNDLNGNHVRDGSPLEPVLGGWEIKLWNAAQTVTVATTTTAAADGSYSFPGVVPGTYVVCETLQGGWTQTAPVAGVVCNNGTRGYTVVVGACCDGGSCTGQPITGKDFGNTQEQPKPPSCPEDLPRGPLMTRTVDPTKAPGGGGVAGNPTNYLTIQAAYNAAKVSPITKDEVIGLFAKTTENVVLDNYTAKSMTITQCTNASATSWDLTANKKLLIIGPDSTGGAIGWYLETGGHELKSIRSNGASTAGVRIKAGANGNSISFNNVASGGIGIDVLSNSNILKSGTIGPNAGAGVHIGPGNTGNSASGMTIQKNNNNGVLVEGNSNTISSNKLNTNSPNGIKVTGNTNTIQSNQSDSNTVGGHSIAGTSNIVKDNKANNNTQVGFDLSGTGQKLTGSASNHSAAGVFDYRISATTAVSAPSSNKADGSSIPSASKCTGFFTNPAVLTCN